MESIISPEFISKDVLAKLFDNTLEPTIDNIQYVWSLASSFNYGSKDLLDEQIDFWISLLPLIRNLFIQSKMDENFFCLSSILGVSYIATQIEQICATRGKKIPDLLKVLEGNSDETINSPIQIINFPIVPTIQYNELVSIIVYYFKMFKPIHGFKIPSYDSIVHYSIVISLIYCDQLHQPNLESYKEFKKRSKYNFGFPTDFVYDVNSMPTIEDPFSFILIRSIFEDIYGIHLQRPFTKDTAFSDIMNIINSSSEKLDETKFYGTLIYVESKQIPFSMSILDSDYPSLLFLMIFELVFNSKILFEKDKVFHFTPNFLMANKFSTYFSKELDFTSLIDMQMKSLFDVAKYVIKNLEPTPIEIISNKDNVFSLSERLHALGSLFVEELREDVYPTVFSYWCSKVTDLISELKTVTITNSHLSGLAGICRVAATFSKKGETRSIDSILNQPSEKIECEVPSTFPSYSYSTPPSVLSQIDEFNVNCSEINDVIRYMLLISFLEIGQKPIEPIERLNSDYFKEELSNPLLFIGLRYIYEKTFNISINRKNTDDNFFNEVCQKESIVSVLNLLVFNQGTRKINLTKEIFEKRSLYFALKASNAFVNDDPLKICDQLCRNGFQVAAYVISKCQTEVENLVTRAYFDDEDAAIQLLQHKECFNLLSSNKESSCHFLLKIFLNDEEPLFSISEDFDDSVELSAKLFVCHNKKPPSTEILIQILKKCYYYYFNDSILSISDKEIFLDFCGVMKKNNIRIFEKEEDFFRNVNQFDEESSLGFANTVLYFTVFYLKDQQHPELINYYSDFASHSRVSPKIKEIIHEKDEYRSIYWFLCSFTNPFNRLDDLSFILDKNIDDKYIQPLYQYLLLNRDAQCLLKMLQSKYCENAIDKIGLTYLHQSLDFFFEIDSSSGIIKMTKILIQNDKDYLIDYICSHILNQTKNSMLIFKIFKMNEELAIQFISHMPKLSINDIQIPNEMISFLKTILDSLPHSILHSSSASSSKSNENPIFNSYWNEDIEKDVVNYDENDSYVNLWKERQYFECEGKNRNIPHPAFCCFTCDMSDSYICTACAATCHKGHHVSYVKKVRFNCACKNFDKCCFCDNQNLLNEEETKNEKRIHPSSFKLIDMMIAVSRMKKEEEENINNDNESKFVSKQIVSRLTKPLSSYFNRTYDLNEVLPRICLTEKKTNFVNLDDLNRLYRRNQQLYIKRCTYIPLNLSTYFNNHFIIAVGKMVYSIDEITYEIDHSLQLNEELLSVKLSKTNDEYLILTSLHSVIIVNSNDLTIISTIMPDNYINQAEMPFENRVAVVMHSSVYLYELNKADPIERYTIHNDFITSAVFVTYQDLPFGIFALNGGRIAIQVFGQQTQSENMIMTFIHFSSLPSTFFSIFISYSPENDLFFIAAPGISLQYTKLENVFKYNPTQPYQLVSETGIRSEIYFYSTFPNVPSLLLFVNPVTNALFAIEFTDKGPEISVIDCLRGQSSMSLFDNRMNLYSLMKTKDEIFGISTNGSLLSLVSNEMKEDSISHDEYIAPPTLFTMSEIATTDNAEIIGTDTSQNYNTLFNDNVAFFHVSVNPKIMTLVLKDESYSIVGFILTFSGQSSSHRPSYLSVFGRKYNCLRDSNIIVPLKPNEIKPGKRLEIEFSNTSTAEIAMQGIRIFIIKTEKIQPFIRFQINNSNDIIKNDYSDDVLKCDLLDFNDSMLNQLKLTSIEKLMFEIVTAISFDEDNERNNVDLINDNVDELKILIRLIYENEVFSNLAKSALIRVIKSVGESGKLIMLKIWADVLKSIIAEKHINDSLWQTAWRDYLLFPKEVKEMFNDAIWDSNPKIGSSESILSAFTFM